MTKWEIAKRIVGGVLILCTLCAFGLTSTHHSNDDGIATAGLVGGCSPPFLKVVYVGHYVISEGPNGAKIKICVPGSGYECFVVDFMPR